MAVFDHLYTHRIIFLELTPDLLVHLFGFLFGDWLIKTLDTSSMDGKHMVPILEFDL